MQVRKFVCFSIFYLLQRSGKCKHHSTNSEKLKLAVNKWNIPDTEEQKTWTEKAKGLQGLDFSELTGKQYLAIFGAGW